MKKKLRVFIMLALIFMFSLTAFADSGFADGDSFIYIAAVIGLPAVIAFVLMFAKLAQMKTAVKQDMADSYMKYETFNVKRSEDVFLYSDTVRISKQESDED